MDYRSRPKGFFRLSADELIADALQQILPADLYGRCNELTDPEGFVFADIVEDPAAPQAARSRAAGLLAILGAGSGDGG